MAVPHDKVVAPQETLQDRKLYGQQLKPATTYVMAENGATDKELHSL